MIKIGILGSDNSHAMGFSHLANVPATDGTYRYEDVRITHIYGHDREQTAQVAAVGQIEHIVSDPAEMLDAVDAVMVVFRDGVHHYRYAEPFIKKGIPVWIDKPVTIEVPECERLIAEAKAHHCLLSGGSSCKLVPDVQNLKAYVKNPQSKIITALLNFNIYLDSIYSGFHFYAPHLVEMTTELFGFDVKSVVSHRNGDSVNAILEYDGFDVHLAFAHGTNANCCVFIEEQRNVLHNIDISDIAKCGMDAFVQSIRSGELSAPMVNLYKVTVILDALKNSFENGGKIILSDKG